MAKATKRVSSRHKPGRSTAKGVKSMRTKSKTMIRYLPGLCEELERAAAGLLNISETIALTNSSRCVNVTCARIVTNSPFWNS